MKMECKWFHVYVSTLFTMFVISVQRSVYKDIVQLLKTDVHLSRQDQRVSVIIYCPYLTISIAWMFITYYTMKRGCK